jgi:Bacterial mobilisation protein (MobC)
MTLTQWQAQGSEIRWNGELLALKRTLGELGSIGRNLNQIAHAANQGQLVTSPGRNDLEAMLRVCGTSR